MSKNGLRRHYDKLTPEERFRLDELATARGVKQESERLLSSCPRLPYTMNDRGFTGRWLAVLDLTLRMYVWMAGHMDRLKTLGAVRAVLPFQDDYVRNRMRDAFVEGHLAGARQVWGFSGGKGPAPEWTHKDGTTSKFREDEVFPGCFAHELERSRRHHFG